MNKLNQSVLLDYSPERAVPFTAQINLEASSLDDFAAGWSDICTQISSYMRKVSATSVMAHPISAVEDTPDTDRMLRYTPQEDTAADEMAAVIQLIRENKIDKPRRGRKPKPATQDNDPLNGFFDFYVICQNKKNFPNAIAKLPGDILSQHVDAGEASVKFERLGFPVRVICLSHPDQVKAIRGNKTAVVIRTDNWFGPADDPLAKAVHEARKAGEIQVIYDTHFLRDWSRGFPVEANRELASAG